MLPPDGADARAGDDEAQLVAPGRAPPPRGGIRGGAGAGAGAALGRGRRRERRLAPVGGQLVEIGVEAPGAGELAERDPAHGVGHHRAAERDVGGELRPRRDRLLDLDHRRRRPIGEARRVEDPDHVRDLLLGREAASVGRRDVAEQPVERRAIGLEIEALDVEHPAMARRHDDGPARGARVLAQAHLHLQVVAFVDDHVGARDELGDGRLLDPAGIGDDADVGIELGDLARGEHDLVHADVGDAARRPG